MSRWPDQPVILEINTWVWLEELRRRFWPGLDLGTVPDEAWAATVPAGVDAVWLMGVWERSAVGAAIARDHEGVRADVRAALPDAVTEDIVGSAYCVRRYTVDPALGGDAALARARATLASRGVRLLLDYVPNHVARDHAWVSDRPELLVGANAEDLQRAPEEFAEIAGSVVALGRDPYFPAWTDVVQLNAFAPALRQAVAQQLRQIAACADGVRCDMAMLLLNDVFARTWGDRVGAPPAEEFWPAIIDAVRREHPEFLFVAEAYWDLESTLLEQGFDYCYDKRLYDVVADADVAALRSHLQADTTYQQRMLRFLENHDEPRAAASLPPGAVAAAAVIVATLPGALLLYEGQFEGRTVRPPVQLARRPEEPVDTTLRRFWERLLAEVVTGPARRGDWTLLPVEGWPDNDTYRRIVAWRWDDHDEGVAVVVNLSEQPAQARIGGMEAAAHADDVVLFDVFAQERLVRDRKELDDQGLHVQLDGWGFHVLRGRW